MQVRPLLRGSRLRLRLTLWFGAAFVSGLLLVSGGVAGWLHVRERRALTRAMDEEARALLRAVRTASRDDAALRAWADSLHAVQQALASDTVDGVVPPALARAASALAARWHGGALGFVVLDARGRVLAARAPEAFVRAAQAVARAAPGDSTADLRLGGEPVRLTLVRDAADPPVAIVSIASLVPLERHVRQLLEWLLVSTPLVCVTALLAGYVLSRRALRPIVHLGRALDAVRPGDLRPGDDGARLPVHHPADELDALAARINDLLGRLAQARTRNRSFLLAAAHRVKTPLTLIQGEAALALGGARSTGEYRIALHRVSAAARQLGHAVDELFLRARADAREQPPLTELVELDGVALEALDQMRARAQELGRVLELETLAPAVVRGDHALLRDAALELLENACRHGRGPAPVRLSVTRSGTTAALAVWSAGPAFAPSHGDASGAGGHGLVILHWIAQVHHGQLWLEHDGAGNAVALQLPLDASSPATDPPGDGSAPAHVVSVAIHDDRP